MIKLAAFDLDGTLAELGKGITAENVRLLKEIEKKGVRIAFCSGKPIYYLCGLLRQIELEHPVMIGENGAVIQMDVDLPPKQYYVQPFSRKAEKAIKILKDEILEMYPDLFFQPNVVGLTPFPRDEAEFDRIQIYLDSHPELLEELIVYRHIDSFDITPKGIDKYTGMQYLCDILKIRSEETAAIGDGTNDYPMFAFAGQAFGIHVADPNLVNINFSNVEQALQYILDII